MDLNSVKGILEAHAANEIALDLATALINTIKEKETNSESIEKPSIEERIKNFIKNEITSCLYHEDYDDVLIDESTLYPEDICKYMRNHNWKWRGEEVTVEMFTNNVKRLVADCISQIIEQYKDDDTREDYSCNVETGGIRVSCFLDKGDIWEDSSYKPTIDVEISFIMQQWNTSFDFEEIIKL